MLRGEKSRQLRNFVDGTDRSFSSEVVLDELFVSPLLAPTLGCFLMLFRQSFGVARDLTFFLNCHELFFVLRFFLWYQTDSRP